MRPLPLHRLVLLLGAAMTLLVLATATPGRALGDGADGRFETRRSPHFVLHQDVDIDRRSGFRGSDRFERDVLATLESAYKRLDDWLGLRPERVIQVWIYDPQVFDARFGGVFRYPVAGFYGGAIHVRGDTVVHQQLVRTLSHELVHAALDQAAPSLVVPAWFNEGLAEWFEHRATGGRHLSAAEWNLLGRAWHQGAWVPVDAMSGTNLAGVPPELAGIAYLQSFAMVERLVRQGGADRLRRLIAGFLRVRDLERAMRRQYRFGIYDLEAQLVGELG